MLMLQLDFHCYQVSREEKNWEAKYRGNSEVGQQSISMLGFKDVSVEKVQGFRA